MKDFLLGLLAGFLITIVALAFLPSTCAKGRDALVSCEKSLPRNQTCVITAIPEAK